MAEHEAELKRCRHGYFESECFTCHVANSADIVTNEKGERVFRMGRAAVEENANTRTKSE